MRCALVSNPMLYAVYFSCSVVIFGGYAKIYAAFLAYQSPFLYLSASLQNSVCGYAPMFGWLSVYALLGK